MILPEEIKATSVKREPHLLKPLRLGSFGGGGGSLQSGLRASVCRQELFGSPGDLQRRWHCLIHSSLKTSISGRGEERRACPRVPPSPCSAAVCRSARPFNFI